MAEINEAWVLFDANGDGTISAEELGEVMKKLGQSPSEDEIQVSHLPAIECWNFTRSRAEPKSTCRRRQPLPALSLSLFHAQEMIKEVDVNGTGKIEKAEFVNLMKNRPTGDGINTSDRDEMMEAFKVIDKDRNGYIDKVLASLTIVPDPLCTALSLSPLDTPDLCCDAISIRRDEPTHTIGLWQEELRTLMANLGETLNDDELEEMMREAPGPHPPTH